MIIRKLYANLLHQNINNVIFVCLLFLACTCYGVLSHLVDGIRVLVNMALLIYLLRFAAGP